MGNCLETQNLWKVYSSERGEVKAVTNVNLAIPTGQFVAIIGRSGSGKSTLMAMIGGLSRPTQGIIKINGIDLWALSSNQRAELRNQQLGFVFQFASLLPTLRAIDNVALPALLGKEANPTAVYDRAAQLLTEVGLSDRREAYPSQLSGGEQRRVAIARSLINAPPLLLADEPTGDLDEATEAEIMALLLQLCGSTATTLVVVTHNLALTQTADQVLILKGGRLETGEQILEPRKQFLVPKPSLLPAAALALAPDPPSLSSAPADSLNITLGSTLGINRRKLLWLLPVLPVIWTIDTGVGTYQRRGLAAKKQVLSRLDQAAHGYLYIDVQNVEYEADGQSYRLTMVMQNLDPTHPLYVLISPLRAFVQSGFLWQEVPVHEAPGEGSRMVKLTTETTFQAIFTPDLEQPTELIPGYMHVRFDTDLLISQRAEPDTDIVARSDPYYVYLKPHQADDAAILRQSHYPGAPPVYLPMPPH